MDECGLVAWMDDRGFVVMNVEDWFFRSWAFMIYKEIIFAKGLKCEY